MDVVEQLGGGAKQDGKAFEDGLVGDVFGQQSLTDAVGSEEDEVSTLAYEVESQRAFDQGPIDFLGPVPVEVGNGLEGAEPAVDAAPFEGSSGAVGSFGAQDFLEECSGSEPILSGPGEQIVEGAGGGSQAEGLQLGGEITHPRSPPVRAGRADRRRSRGES